MFFVQLFMLGQGFNPCPNRSNLLVPLKRDTLNRLFQQDHSFGLGDLARFQLIEIDTAG